MKYCYYTSPNLVGSHQHYNAVLRVPGRAKMNRNHRVTCCSREPSLFEPLASRATIDRNGNVRNTYFSAWRRALSDEYIVYTNNCRFLFVLLYLPFTTRRFIHTWDARIPSKPRALNSDRPEFKPLSHARRWSGKRYGDVGVLDIFYARQEPCRAIETLAATRLRSFKIKI